LLPGIILSAFGASGPEAYGLCHLCWFNSSDAVCSFFAAAAFSVVALIFGSLPVLLVVLVCFVLIATIQAKTFLVFMTPFCRRFFSIFFGVAAVAREFSFPGTAILPYRRFRSWFVLLKVFCSTDAHVGVGS